MERLQLLYRRARKRMSYGGRVDPEIDIEEGTKTCAPYENVCFGRLTVTTVNLTTFGNETTTAIELQIEKGCDTIDNYTGIVILFKEEVRGSSIHVTEGSDNCHYRA